MCPKAAVYILSMWEIHQVPAALSSEAACSVVLSMPVQDALAALYKPSLSHPLTLSMGHSMSTPTVVQKPLQLHTKSYIYRFRQMHRGIPFVDHMSAEPAGHGP